MEILVKRIAKKNLYTIGKMYINDTYFCDVLEDTDRGLQQNMKLSEIVSKKVPNKTAIPTGTYKIAMNIVSSRFKDRSWAKPYSGKLPRLLNVPGFDGVLIHSGNDQDHTSGCLLVGRNKIVGKVLDSQNTFKALMKRLHGQQSITITIE